MAEEKRVHPEIAAKFVGPAPNKYVLPPTIGVDKDKTLPQEPSYSIRPNTWKITDHSPGPIYGFNSRMTRRGLSSIPTTRIIGRHKESYIIHPDFMLPPQHLWEGIQDNPGPNQYCMEKFRIIRERTAPAFSLKPRPKVAKNTMPSPCAYTLPEILGERQVNLNSVPFYSMNKRIEYNSYSYDFAKTPGPAGYKVSPMHVTLKQPPIYSLKDRTLIPKFKMDNPGPGAYDLHSAKFIKRTAPKYSLGIKHSPYKMPVCQDIFY